MSEAGALDAAGIPVTASASSDGVGGVPVVADRYSEPDEDHGMEELEPLTLPQVVRAVQQTALPIPLQNPALLPLYQLDPEVLERLAAEVISHRNNLGAHFYGRRGQKQYGLDIVEFEPGPQPSLYQVKRYEAMSGQQMADIVEEYAGPPHLADYEGPKRRFDPHRFVIMTSAAVEADTAATDAIHGLQALYRGDLTIEVWGAEALGRMLRHAPHTVAAIFGPAWAKAWCGFDPAPIPPDAPTSLGLVEGPLSVLNLDALEADAADVQASEPLAAAAMYGTIAQALQDGNFPGHAAAMRRRQAEAAEAGGDRDRAFDILFRLALERVLAGESLNLGGLRHQLEQMSASLNSQQQDKLAVLSVIADWYEQGSQLATSVPALARLAESTDSDSAVLNCLIIEQALVDGLYDDETPDSVVARVATDTVVLLRDLAGLAAASDTKDVLIRARLHCAVADSALTLAADTEAVAVAYATIVDNALAGRYRHARGLVASRAAYAFAVRGYVDRANTLWRQSILASSEDGYYGDVRNAMRASWQVSADNGVFDISDFNVVTSALPNQRRLLSGANDPVLGSLDAAHRDKLPDAFGESRRFLWESRLAGHFLEEMLAWSLFGDIVAAADQQAPAVVCYVMAGQAEKAAKLAAGLPELMDMSGWSSSRLRRRRAAALRVIGAQTALVPDDHVSSVVEELLAATRGLWDSRYVAPHPEVDALKAIASFGVRIPETAVDPILAAVGPALSQNSMVSRLVAELLIQIHWAVESRRDDVATAIESMLRLAASPHGLWDLLPQMPAVARGSLLPVVAILADTGHAEAISTLASWRYPSPVVYLAARRACAALLRRPVGVKRTSVEVGTQESATVNLLLALLQADEPGTVPLSELTPEKSKPAGGVFFSIAFSAGPSPEPTADQDAMIDRDEDASAALTAKVGGDLTTQVDEPDEAAITAAGSPVDLAVAVAHQLAAMAEDTHAGGASRTNALFAMRRLLPALPPTALVDLVPAMLKISREPALSEADLFEITTDTRLSRARSRTGVKDLAGMALVAAAEAFAGSRDTSAPASEVDHALVSEVVALAVELLRDNATDSQNPLLGALCVAAIAKSVPDYAPYATGLLFHDNEQVRAIGARYTQGSSELFHVIAGDPSPDVRAALASRSPELTDQERENLAHDPHLAVRWSIANSVE